MNKEQNPMFIYIWLLNLDKNVVLIYLRGAHIHNDQT